jgi:hypothetical protein
MTDDRSLERAARSWMEVGPTRAPEAAVAAALDRIQGTSQERDLAIPRRFRTMTNPFRLAAAVVIAVLVIGGGLLILRGPAQPTIGGPSPSPSPSATPLPSPSGPVVPSPSGPVVPSSTLIPFSSTIYPYAISYPSNWKSRGSERPISATEFPYDYNVGVDYFSASAPTIGDPGLIAAAPVVDSGTTLASWIANINAMQACGATDGSEALQLAGVTGRLLTWQKCPVFLMWATVLNGDRAYNVIWINSNSDGDAALQAADKARFLHVLASFAFTPTPASPTPSGSAAN